MAATSSRKVQARVPPDLLKKIVKYHQDTQKSISTIINEALLVLFPELKNNKEYLFQETKSISQYTLDTGHITAILFPELFESFEYYCKDKHKMKMKIIISALRIKFPSQK